MGGVQAAGHCCFVERDGGNEGKRGEKEKKRANIDKCNPLCQKDDLYQKKNKKRNRVKNYRHSTSASFCFRWKTETETLGPECYLHSNKPKRISANYDFFLLYSIPIPSNFYEQILRGNKNEISQTSHLLSQKNRRSTKKASCCVDPENDCG